VGTSTVRGTECTLGALNRIDSAKVIEASSMLDSPLSRNPGELVDIANADDPVDWLAVQVRPGTVICQAVTLDVRNPPPLELDQHVAQDVHRHLVLRQLELKPFDESVDVAVVETVFIDGPGVIATT
jgi:hypothetical protein